MSAPAPAEHRTYVDHEGWWLVTKCVGCDWTSRHYARPSIDRPTLEQAFLRAERDADEAGEAHEAAPVTA